MVFQLDIEALRQSLDGVEPGRLDGKRVSEALLVQVTAGVEALRARGIVPCLAVLQVGEDPASQVYVRNKVRSCGKVGMESRHFQLPGTVSAQELRGLLGELSRDASVHGILLQLPIPEELSALDAMMSIAPEKDVDGFHPLNLGCLASGRAELEPCTPRGIMTLLEVAGVSCRGKRAVVIGRSVIVGRPIAQMLVRADCTVTVCHRFTEDLAAEVQRADIVVVATGVPELVRGAWIKPGAVVIDVGITRTETGKLVGDVEFEEAARHASAITPVPGGVGPMTVATLLENTVRAACLQNGLRIVDGVALDQESAPGPDHFRLTFV